MTITMSLEIEVGTTLEEIFLSLSDFGANPCIDNGIVSGNFKASNTYFVFRECDGVNEIATEDAGADWYVGTRGAMHCPVESLAASSDDVRQFLIFLSKTKSCRFILSFQYESTYAIRDEGGLRFLKEIMDQ